MGAAGQARNRSPRNHSRPGACSRFQILRYPDHRDPPIVCDLPEVIIKPASTWLRTLAGACDFEIIAIAYLPIFAAYATLNTSLSNAAFVILSLLLCAFTFIYQFVTLSLAGRTFGMAILNLRIVDKEYETRTVTLRQKALRAWGASIAFICPPLNFLVMRFNRHHYSLPDLLSGTAPVPNQQS
ncbi:MAG: RDD family protein [Acidobacteria bacterium]|nr:RDD family protein [Acidobacteriota bacterium]